MTPEEYCQEKAAGSGSSFYYSFLFLPSDKRRAITAMYAFCREVDDVVDECSSPELAAVKLHWWRAEVDRTFEGKPEHPVGKALLPVLARHDLPREYFHEIIDGMEMDLSQSSYATFEELTLYCHRVAGVVGLAAAEIFGYSNHRTLKYAENLGLAFQLTNILRDVREDAGRGRVYLPRDELGRFGVSAQMLNTGATPDNVRELFAFQAERARRHYTKAYALLPNEDRESQRSGIVMAAIYRATLDEIENDGFRILEHRIALTPIRKLWLACKTIYLEGRGR